MIPQSAIPLLALGGVVLVGANLAAATEYLEVVRVPKVPVAAQDATPEATPSGDTPGSAAAKRLIGPSLAKHVKVRAAAQGGVGDILGFACGRDSADSAVVAYQRHVAVERQPLVAGVELWPSGYGAAAIDAILQRAEACAGRGGQVTALKRTVAGYPAVLVTILAGADTIRTLRWSVGDITLSLTGRDIPLDDAAIKGWSRRAATLLQPICADLKPSVADARRSPWRDPERYRGLTDRATVEADLPSIAEELPPKRKKLLGLAPVERPDPPSGVPYWPASLPVKEPRPEQPARPKQPPTKRSVRFQIPDPTGPGCGWSFTASPSPEFTQAESDVQRDQRLAEAAQQLDEELASWAAAEAQWRGAMNDYYVAALDYREYGDEVAAADRAWDAIRDDWNRYYLRVSQRQQAIAQRGQWLAAAEAWKTNRCPAGARAPKNGRGSANSQQPSATGCLTAVPQILWKPLPQIPPVPTPPADPRPPSAR